jgi:hypothetical protein
MIKKIYREYGETVFIETPGKRGTISAKSGMEASVDDDKDLAVAQQALQTLVELDVKRVLKAKLATRNNQQSHE